MSRLWQKAVLHSALVSAIGASSQALACGGFFCDFVPIDQAGEQIVFRQDGDATTAMIKIDYVGNAEDFGWVLPVPNTPEISLGSDQIFTELELATRPQFLLERKGEGCPIPESRNIDSAAAVPVANLETDGDVNIEQSLSVGPFDAQIISSDNPDALATWLADNNLDLTDQGSALLTPYVQAGSKFVVLKLKNNVSVGSIQPVILKYQASKPVIPMTLTGVAAQDNMGVLVWLLGNGRGVPVNFKHVTPNYSRLNWFSGPRSAYASYQTLITAAMDEAGGQGFATDFAGFLPNLPERFTTTDRWRAMLTSSADLSDASFISNFWNEGIAAVQDAIRAALPTSSQFIYSQPLVLAENFTAEQLTAARESVRQIVEAQVIAPVDNAIDLLDDNIYLTRLYTTLSANEMTANPEFSFNPMMDDQALSRNATLTSECINGEDHWTLELGAGTGREGELVVDSFGFGQAAGNAVTSTEQPAMWRAEKTSDSAAPIVVAENTLTPVVRGDASKGGSAGSGGAAGAGLSLLALLGLMIRRHRR